MEALSLFGHIAQLTWLSSMMGTQVYFPFLFAISVSRPIDILTLLFSSFNKASPATLSVIDPAYPPTRQVIYFEVAQPHALVDIARVTDEARPLAPIVRSYIDEELQLKAEVPSLRIGDSDVLSGGEVSGKDLFTQVRAKAS